MTEIEQVPVDNVFIIEKDKLKEVVAAAVQRTEEWPIPELETLAAAMSAIIERYRFFIVILYVFFQK